MRSGRRRPESAMERATRKIAEAYKGCKNAGIVNPEKLGEAIEALENAHKHVEELREAWRTGAITERDGLGGTRSNRNVEVEVAIRSILAALREEQR